MDSGLTSSILTPCPDRSTSSFLQAAEGELQSMRLFVYTASFPLFFWGLLRPMIQ